MNGRIILIGLAIFGISLIANLPSIILGMAGSPIKSEGDAMIRILDEFQDTPIVKENSQSQEVLSNTKRSIGILNSIPSIIMIIGFLIIIIGFFI